MLCSAQLITMGGLLTTQPNGLALYRLYCVDADELVCYVSLFGIH